MTLKGEVDSVDTSEVGVEKKSPLPLVKNKKTQKRFDDLKKKIQPVQNDNSDLQKI